MGEKEKLAKEYTNWLHKEVEEYFGQKCDPKDMYYRNGDIKSAYVEGWDAAVNYLANLPFDKMLKYFESILKNKPFDTIIEENKDILKRLKDK